MIVTVLADTIFWYYTFGLLILQMLPLTDIIRAFSGHEQLWWRDRLWSQCQGHDRYGVWICIILPGRETCRVSYNHKTCHPRVYGNATNLPPETSNKCLQYMVVFLHTEYILWNKSFIDGANRSSSQTHHHGHIRHVFCLFLKVNED